MDKECTRTVVARRFGLLVKGLRLGRGLAQGDFQMPADVKRRTLGDIEVRKTHATIENGKRINSALPNSGPVRSMQS